MTLQILKQWAFLLIAATFGFMGGLLAAGVGIREEAREVKAGDHITFEMKTGYIQIDDQARFTIKAEELKE